MVILFISYWVLYALGAHSLQKAATYALKVVQKSHPNHTLNNIGIALFGLVVFLLSLVAAPLFGVLELIEILQ